VAVNSRLTPTDHVDGLMSTCSSVLNLMRTLRNHEIPEAPLKDVFRVIALYSDCYTVLLHGLVSVLRQIESNSRPSSEGVRDTDIVTRPCLRSRSDAKELIQKTPTLNNCYFLIRLLYKDCY